MDSYNSNDSYNSKKMSSGMDTGASTRPSTPSCIRPDTDEPADSYESNDYSSRRNNLGSETESSSSMARESGRTDMASGMGSSSRGGDDFESAASREGRTTMGTETSYEAGSGSGARDSYDSNRSGRSGHSQQSESSYGLQKESAGFGSSGRGTFQAGCPPFRSMKPEVGC